MQRKLMVKILAVFFIAIFLLIPVAMIQGKISERSHYRQQARWQLQESWTREQRVIVPVLVQAYVALQKIVNYDRDGKPVYEHERVQRYHFIIPENVNIDVEIITELRSQGIYAIPVYTAALDLSGDFQPGNIDEELTALRAREEFVEMIDTPYLALGVSDMRGLSGSPELIWNHTSVPLQPGTKIVAISDGVHGILPNIDVTENIPFRLVFSLRGMESFHLVPAAANTTASMRSNWPHPQFSGAFLPDSREIVSDGFTAQWNINQFSTGIEQKLNVCGRGNCDNLDSIAFGSTLFNSVDVYQQTERSAKYAILFIGLTFVSFFVLETLKALRIHAIQYSLVGFAIAVFFLLLLSLSEHIAFGFAYLVASAACILLIGYYLQSVLKTWRITAMFVGAHSGLYSLLFCIVQAEDYALLMGSLLIFVVLAAIMISTRSIDWYNLKMPGADPSVDKKIRVSK